jgi:hypothetical protein
MLPVCSNFQIVACGLAINSGFQRTLQRVRGERRLRTLQGLGRALLQAKTAEQVGPLAMQSLAGNPCARQRRDTHVFSRTWKAFGLPHRGLMTSTWMPRAGLKLSS